jgi:hypothetical protein
MVTTVRGSGLSRGMALVIRMQELQAEQRRGNQWYPRVQNPVRKRAPYPGLHLAGCNVARRVHRKRCKAFGVATQFTVTTGKRGELPRGMPLVTRVEELQSEHARDPMASSSVHFYQKTRTVRIASQTLVAGLVGPFRTRCDTLRLND